MSRLKSVGNSLCIRSSKEERPPVEREVGISKLLVCAVAMAHVVVRQIVDLKKRMQVPLATPECRQMVASGLENRRL